MASRALAVAASRQEAASDQTTAMASKKTTKTYMYKTDSSGNVSREVHTHVDSSSDTSHVAMKRMEERIRILEEDLDSEQHLRKRIDREKHDLQLQIIALSERLTEAEGGAESQLDINRKREAEMSKLRKLLEDVHLESEQNIHILRKKHQEAMMEMQEQIEIISKSKEKVVKEKSSLQIEINELLQKVEFLSQERISTKKVVEKLEINIVEYSHKIEELNKTCIDITSQKTRLQQESQDNARKLNDMKLVLDNAGLDRNKLGNALKELQANADNMQRERNAMHEQFKGADRQNKSLVVEIEELRQVKINLERIVETLKVEVADYKKKYDLDGQKKGDLIEELKKKNQVLMAELEDQRNSFNSKLKTLDQQKGRLQQDNQAMLKDIEKLQMALKDATNKYSSQEKHSHELAMKLREMTNLYEKADKEGKLRSQDIIKLANEIDRLKMDLENALKDRAKSIDEVRSIKVEYDSLKKRLYEIEQENRKLVHDREELARAFKDAEGKAAKYMDHNKDLENELNKLKKSADSVIAAKDEEFMVVKKKLLTEIDTLSVRLHETESRLKQEVEKIKKKMAVTITELELSLDSANKSNMQLQNSSKQHAQKNMELTTIVSELNKKLQATGGHNNELMQKLHIMETELVKTKQILEQTVIVRRDLESKSNEFTMRINELAANNANLLQVNKKLEKDFSSVSLEYTDISKELKMADERANKALHDAQHYEGMLREEQAKATKSENAKRALENEVRSLTVRMEEIETSSLTNSRRTISKMEMRIEELEVFLDKERKLHVETTSTLHKKERSIKELLLQSEEDRKNILILQESLDRLNDKIKMYKRQLEEQEQISNSNIMRVKKFQRELEAAEGRAEEAESSLNTFRSKSRVYSQSDFQQNVASSDETEREVVIKKTIINQSSATSDSNRMDMSRSSAYSRAGSVARASMSRAASMGRSGSTLRY